MKDIKSKLLFSRFAKSLFIAIVITLYIVLMMEGNRIDYGSCEGKHLASNATKAANATGQLQPEHTLELEVEVEVEERDFVITRGCHVGAVKPLAAAVLPFIQQLRGIVCPRVQLLITETIAGKNYLFLNHSESQLDACCGVQNLSEVNCTYFQLRRKDDFRNTKIERKYFNLSRQSRYLEVGSGNQYLWVKCAANGESFYNDTLFFVAPPTMEQQPKPHGRLSVLILGIDSLSHMHYRRSFPQVAEFIEQLPHTEFWGYNRIGRNTFPNMIRLLSGLSPKELNDSCVSGNKTFDDCHLLWDDFKAAGYTTSYGEDSDIYDIFTLNKRGFVRQPTDFYLRPVMQNIRQHTQYEASGWFGAPSITMSCTGGRLYQDVLHEFIYKLMPHMRRQPTFSLFWQSSGVHDYFNYAQTLDEHYVRILRELHVQGIMNHTLILLMSDHGLRFQGSDSAGNGYTQTFQGMEEMSQPLLMALYPEWLGERFPLAMWNLERNAHSLVTTFDLHETLKDVIHLDERLSDDQLEKRTLHLANERGISLFLPIPGERNCTTAQIPGHFCLCFKLRKISRKESSVQKAAQFVLDSINGLIKPYAQCQPLRLVKILAAYNLSGRKQKAGTKRPFRASYDRYATQKAAEVDYESSDSEGRAVHQIRVRLKTRPGEGRFDASVLIKPQMRLLGPVTRTDKYESKSHCVNDYHIERYCNCL
ncbi:uncharacterized protein LOC111078777 [Drosophila obscura]|uniref:uncharacterized protein LOC111078777 n=1 Tax=Drosophila obscura TaxID=7282 RepID=UPI001BB19FD6|nr:uncharacterized protein LOC111078777 [Drosophila obscura]